MPGLWVVFVFVVSAAASWVLVRAVGRYARARALLDVPNERSSHRVPTPRLGGVAIVLLTLLGPLAVQVASDGNWLGAGAGRLATYFWILWAGGAAVALISIIDDLRGVPTAVRFLVHFAAGAAAVWGAPGGASHALTLPGLEWTLPAAWTAPLLMIWVVGCINAFNFMDGIDGIAGGQALLGALAWLALGAWSGSASLTGWAVFAAGSVAGFLLHNWHPATIFMGDVGSAFLGFLFGVLPLWWLAQPAPVAPDRTAPDTFVALAAAALFIWPFIVDAGGTFLWRLVRRVNVFQAHREHAYQRLVRAGRTHAEVATAYSGLAAGGALCAIPVLQGQTWGLGLALGYIALAGGAVAWMSFRAGSEGTP